MVAGQWDGDEISELIAATKHSKGEMHFKKIYYSGCSLDEIESACAA